MQRRLFRFSEGLIYGFRLQATLVSRADPASQVPLVQRDVKVIKVRKDQ